MIENGVKEGSAYHSEGSFRGFFQEEIDNSNSKGRYSLPCRDDLDYYSSKFYLDH